MKSIIKILLATLSLGLFFSLGFITNMVINTDILCDDPEPARTTKALEFKDITINEGAIIPVRMCEYANRFTLEFWLPNKLEKDDFEFTGLPHSTDIDYAGGGSNE